MHVDYNYNLIYKENIKRANSFAPGVLVKVVETVNTPIDTKKLNGLVGMVVTKRPTDVYYSNATIIFVLIDEKIRHIHCLDLELVS